MKSLGEKCLTSSFYVALNAKLVTKPKRRRRRHQLNSLSLIINVKITLIEVVPEWRNPFHVRFDTDTDIVTEPNRSAIRTTSELCTRFATERRASLAVRFISQFHSWLIERKYVCVYFTDITYSYVYTLKRAHIEGVADRGPWLTANRSTPEPSDSTQSLFFDQKGLLRFDGAVKLLV